MNKIYIDGQAGTTGLQIHSRLSGRDDIEILEIDADYRKDLMARRELINASDITILCLPDLAAKEAVSLVDSESVRILDASSAHRITDQWVYGLPEMSLAQKSAIKNARWVSNPGCYPTGAILLLRPLIEAGLLSPVYPYAINAVSGYTGGGREAIERFENTVHEKHISAPIRRYAYANEHKHIKEIKKYSELAAKPIFMPSYGHYAQGIILQIPIYLSMHNANLTANTIRNKLTEYYSDSSFVAVLNNEQTELLEGVEPEIHNNTNTVSLMVLAPENTDHAVLCAVYDNLGKGASGAAVQNLEIMLGLPESDGLVSAAL